MVSCANVLGCEVEAIRPVNDLMRIRLALALVVVPVALGVAQDSTQRRAFSRADTLRGSITLEHQASTVRLVNTTYDNADDRPLVGQGTLQANEVDMMLVPENGDTDYRALVRFVFDATGDQFCVQCSDTNDDRGALGSYTGRRQ